jgi:YggT family protein
MLDTAFTIIYYVIHYTFIALIVLMIARWILSWFRLSEGNPIMLFLARCTDPFIRPIRRRIPPVAFLDMSWIFAFVALYIMQFILIQALPVGR